MMLQQLFIVRDHIFQIINHLYNRVTRYILQLQPLPGSQITLNMDLKGRIIVYSIVGCPHCMRAKNILQDHFLPYHDIGLDKFPQCREYVKTRTGKSTVPQIFFNNIYVGGNEELQKLVGLIFKIDLTFIRNSE